MGVCVWVCVWVCVCVCVWGGGVHSTTLLILSPFLGIGNMYKHVGAYLYDIEVSV